MLVLANYFCSLLHCKIDVTLMVGLLPQKVFSCDLLDKISEAARAFSQTFSVTFQSQRQRCVTMGLELKNPRGASS
jgi:hypothetical protein